MLYCVPGFGLGTNFHWLPSQCSIRVRCTLSAPAYCPTDHASVAESAVTAVSRPSAPTLGVGTLVQPFNSCTRVTLDRKSTRLNSSHTVISYAVFCLKKKNTSQKEKTPVVTPRCRL